MSWFDENGIATQPVSTAGPVAAMPLGGSTSAPVSTASPVAAAPAGGIGGLLSSVGSPYGATGTGTAAGLGSTIGAAGASMGGLAGMVLPSMSAAMLPTSTAGPVASAPLAGSSTAPASGNPMDPSYIQQQVIASMQQAGITPSGPGSGPGDVAYYVKRIGETGGWNADAPGYWGGPNGRITNGGAQAGQGGGTGSLGGGAQTIGGVPGIDPSYGFRFQQGLDALQRSAASRGTLLTGGTLKAINNYGQGAASQEYGADFARQMGLASLGENAAAGQGNNNSGYANSATNALTNNANAQGAAGITNANIIGGAATNVGNLYGLGQLTQSGYGNAGAPTFPQGPAASPFQPLPGALNAVG
jgi:hypothetical protein